MRNKFAVLLFVGLMLVSGAAAQDIDLNLDLNLFGGSDNATDNREQPQQQNSQDQRQQEPESAIDRDHESREVEEDPITSQEPESESGGIMGSISGFVSSIFG